VCAHYTIDSLIIKALDSIKICPGIRSRHSFAYQGIGDVTREKEITPKALKPKLHSKIL